MNPFSINPLHALAAGVVALAIGFGGGWMVNGWRLDADIASLKAQHAKQEATQATAALTTMKDDAAAIHRAATEFAGIESTLAPRIAALTKELRNAPRLPDNCRPDDFRVRHLDAAIEAANQAAIGK